MHSVFISYSTKDTKRADMVRQVLENNGIRCWIAPRNIPTGSNYAREIPAAIANCKVFLLLFSKNAQGSQWVFREVENAINKEKIIIPVMLENFAIDEAFTFFLSVYQRYEAYEQSSVALNELVKQIKTVLGEDTAQPASKETAPKKTVPMEEPSKETAPTPPAVPAVPKTVSVPQPLRFDGLYQGKRPGPGVGSVRDFLRFFPDGTVIYARYNAVASQARKWMGPNFPVKATYIQTENKIHFDIPTDGDTLLFRCSLQPNEVSENGQLKKQGKLTCSLSSKASGKLLTQFGFSFMPVAFPASYGRPSASAVSADSVTQAASPDKKMTAPAEEADLPAPDPMPVTPAPAAKPAPPAQTPSLPVIPLPAEAWQERRPPAALRTDGIYQSQLDGHKYYYLRFFRDGLKYSVIQAVSSEAPCQVMRWMNEQGLRAECYFSKTAVHFSIRTGMFSHSMTYEGTIEANGLKLKAYFRREEKLGDYQFTFFPYPPETARRGQEIESERSGLQRLFAKEPELRYDGYYRSQEDGPGRTYLWFERSGFVQELCHPGPEEDVASLFEAVVPKRRNPVRRNHYYQDGDEIHFVIPFKMGQEKIRYSGKVYADALVLIAHFSATGRYYLQRYTFVPHARNTGTAGCSDSIDAFDVYDEFD